MVFHQPIICRNVPLLVPGWTRPIVIVRHAFGDQYRATDVRMPGPGTLTIRFVGDYGQTIERGGYRAPGEGVAMAMHNLDSSIRDLARLPELWADVGLAGLSFDQAHDPESLRRTFEGPVPGGVRREIR